MMAIYEATWKSIGGLPASARCEGCPLRPIYCPRCGVDDDGPGAECAPDAVQTHGVPIPAR